MQQFRNAGLTGLALLASAGQLPGAEAVASGTSDKTITKVVKMLEAMQAKSRADGDADRETFAKHKCYCDAQQATKEKEVAALTEDIAGLEASIAELKGGTGVLSTECAQLKADMAENEKARAEAQRIRDEEHDSFVALEADLVKSIGQMKNALKELAEVGADQTAANAGAADHATFMAGKNSFAQASSTKEALRVALARASALADPAQRRRLAGFLQAPFTGTYTAQSGEVVGILKSMSDTFDRNLKDARAAEDAQLAAHTKLMATKEAAHAEMQKSYDEKQGSLGSNDGDLASKQASLRTAEESKTTKETFLSELVPMCAQKAQEYEKRKALRANEDAAIAEAVSILNSDASFATFGTVSATSTGATSFLQSVSISSHKATSEPRVRVQQLLRRAVALQQLKGPEDAFSVVLGEIKKMEEVIVAEGKADKEKRQWCRSERSAQNGALGEKRTQETQLKAAILSLEGTIGAPDTGLKALIETDETSLRENEKSAKEAAELRAEENKAYLEDVANLQEAAELVSRAVKVLSAYYEGLDTHGDGGPSGDAAEDQVLTGETSAVPKTWESEEGYRGQSTKGTSAISMLQFILDETKKEEVQADTDEAAAQKAYDELQARLSSEAEDLQKNLATLRSTLAAKEKELSQKTKDLKDTQDDATAIEKYLASIKDGCDFMETNFDDRERRRAAETAALAKATELLKGTPAFQAAEATAHVEALGPCKEVCAEDEEHANCKACLAEVSVPGYCAGHPGTKGC
eukprot:TRINITY_DN71439_c0_g1_i1.p1 TRINITY_DN71439_c0_g1~~TRINITY_DN71439_c0_g1_i1.p1  ORF type:complete len:755 (-),score=264.11 TRINITY_DN71439_c0_g1_i1:53-2317(-)